MASSSSKVGQLKPFMLEEKKEGPDNTISETTFNKWKGCMIANVKKEDKWLPFVSQTWLSKKEKNHGLKGEKADSESNLIDGLLEYVAQYAPNALYRDITRRATSLESIWILVRKWAGLKTSGSKHHAYYKVKNSYSATGDLTPNDFFFTL